MHMATFTAAPSPILQGSCYNNFFPLYHELCSYKPSSWIVVKTTWVLCAGHTLTAQKRCLACPVPWFFILYEALPLTKAKAVILLEGRLCFCIASVTGRLTVLKVTEEMTRWYLGIKAPPRALTINKEENHPYNTEYVSDLHYLSSLQ